MRAARKVVSRNSREEAEERLVVEAAQKNPARFADLYEKHMERVYAYIVRRVGDRTAAEDLTSDVFHRALENLPRYEWRGAPFAAWLYQIAAHALADRWKRLARERSNLAAGEPAETAEPDWEAVEQTARLFRLIAQLPNDQRRVIEMRFAGEKSIREIAQELGRSQGAVKQLQFRGLESLRKQMGKGND